MIKYDSFIRDPLYGFIGLKADEIKLVNTDVFQRLRNIKQLANTHLVYPSACHTRFEHSLGVLHIATRMAQQLGLSDDKIEMIRYASLLHDIGHGPFSHVFEKILSDVNSSSVTHEDITKKIINNNDGIKEILDDKLDGVISLFSETNETVSNQIISGNIDADKLDYLRRDSYHVGVSYGEFDLERVLNTINKKEEGERSYLTVLEKGRDALESFRLARFLMHSQVYNHHTRLISDCMLQRAVEVALRDDIIDKDHFNIQNNEFLKNYLHLDDSRLVMMLLNTKNNNAYELANNLDKRCLLKRGYVRELNQHRDAILKQKLIQMNKSDGNKLDYALSEVCKCDADFIISFKIRIDNSLFSSPSELLNGDKTPILIETKSGDIEELDKLSSLFGSWEPIIKFFVFCPEQYRETVNQHTEDIIKDNL